MGLHHGPLVAVRDARSVEGTMYARLETELMAWAGALCDTVPPLIGPKWTPHHTCSRTQDESAWTPLPM